jgi:hypothetical protein
LRLSKERWGSTRGLKVKVFFVNKGYRRKEVLKVMAKEALVKEEKSTTSTLGTIMSYYNRQVTIAGCRSYKESSLFWI